MIKLKHIYQAAIILLVILCGGLTAYAAQYTYDDLGRVVKVVYDSGQVITYTYDEGGNIKSATTTNPLTLSPIGNKTVNEGQTLKFTLRATASITYSAANLPTGAKINSKA